LSDILHSEPFDGQGDTLTAPSPDPEIREYRLPGAVDLLVYPTRKFKTTLVNLLVHRPLGEATSAGALVPYVLRRGTRRRPDMASISRELERLFGAGLDVEVLRFGERQILSFRLDVVDDRYLLMGGRDLLRHGLALLRDILTDPVLEGGRFPANVFEQERLNLRHFVEGMTNDKARYALDRCIRHMCGDEPYARYEYGEPAEIGALSPEAVTSLWRETLRTSPLEIYVVGSAEPEAVREIVEELFGTLRDGSEVSEPPRGVRRRAGRIRRVEEHGDLVQSRLVLGYRTAIDYGDRLSAALGVWNTVFGGGSYSRLFRHVREKHSLAYYCSSVVDLAKGVAFVQAGIDGKMADRVERIVRRQLAELKRGRLDLDELRTAKAFLKAGLMSVTDSPARISAFLQEQRAAGLALSFDDALSRISRVRRSDTSAAAESVELDTVYLFSDGGA
jgi:predicted Zn-dependent peptidase